MTAYESVFETKTNKYLKSIRKVFKYISKYLHL